jgi:thiol-disulfide isomerase/thioredoxin
MSMAARARVIKEIREVPVPSRRSLLSCVVGAAALTGGPLAVSRAVGRSATPELVGIDGWLNTEGPLTIAGLRGKPVLVEFCTYTCINWRRTLPYMNRWDWEYGPRGLQIIGVHTPEFGFERVRANVERAIRELGVRYPIAQDNASQTWRAWDNRAWPSFYLVDQHGQVRLVREGEGHSQEIEGAIRGLLGLPRAGSREHPNDDADLSRIRTPEIYFGSLHPTPQDRKQSPRPGEATYAIAQAGGPNLNEYQLDGTWARGEEPLVLRSPRGRVRLRFSAAKLYLIAGAPQPAPVRVSVDAAGERTIQVGMPTLYTLLDGTTYGEHLLELECATPGLSLFSATFG